MSGDPLLLPGLAGCNGWGSRSLGAPYALWDVAGP